MQHNTALAFLLAGSGLLFSHAMHRIASALGALAGLIGGVTLLQYLAGTDFGVDRLVIDTREALSGSHSGRMAASSASCFVLLGTSLMLVNRPEPSRRASAIGRLASAVAGVFATGALLGHVTGLGAGFGWQSLQMAPQTAALFIVLSATLLFLAPRGGRVSADGGEPTASDRSTRLLPAATTGVALLFSLLAWLALSAHEERLLRERLAADALLVRQAVEAAVAERAGVVARMARRWELTGSRTREQFELEAAVNQQSYPALRALGWVSPELVVQWVHPAQGNEAALGLAVNADPVRAGTYARALRGEHEVALSSPLTLVQGGLGMLAVTSLQVSGVDAGYIYAAFNPSVLLGRILDPVAVSQPLLIEAGNTSVFVREGPRFAGSASEGFSLGGIGWKVTVWRRVESPTLPLVDIALAISAALSLMLGTALHGRMLASGEARRVEAALQQAQESRKALIRSETQYRAIVETATDAIVVIDARGTVRAVNPACKALFGYTAEEMVGRNVSTLMPDADGAAHDGYLVGIRRELVGRRKDGAEFPFELSVAQWESGGERFYTGLMRDVSARKAAEALLRSSERAAAEAARFLQSVIDGAIDPIFVKDLEGRFLLANGRTAEVFGVPLERVRGCRDEDFLPREVADAVTRIDQEVIRRACPVMQEEVIPEGGEQRVYLTTKTPLLDADGKVAGVIGVARDITDRNRAQAEVLRLNAELEARVVERTRQLAEANAELDGFAHTVAHDLRAPLRSMRGFSQVLIEDYGEALDEAARDYLVRIAKGAERMDMLIQDLLAYARVGREDLQLSPVSFDMVVAEAGRQIEATLKEARADIDVSGPLPAVLAHRPVLVQVVVNLLSNAVKFVPAGRKPKIRIDAERRGLCVRLWISDNGIGIAPEHQGRIFGVFQRLHGMSDYAGTGVGLAIVRRGVERMGGTAGVESEPGKGSRFWVELKGAEAG
jgi:PAS domain S-box-containing protein